MAETKLDWRAIVVAGVSAAVLAGTTPGLAGFAWKAPSSSAPTSSSDVPSSDIPVYSGSGPAVSAVPVSPVESDLPADLPPPSSMPAPLHPHRSSIVEAPPTPAYDAPLPPPSSAPSPAPAAVSWDHAASGTAPHIRWDDASHKTAVAASDSKDIVAGFGSDLPLQVALQQVVPSQYKVSLGNDVDSGVHVSWQGGKPWRDVLADMLAPVRLSFTLQGNALQIKRGGSTTLSPRVAHSGSSHQGDIPDNMISGVASKPAASTAGAPSQLFTKSQPAPVAAAPKQVPPPPAQEADVLPLTSPVQTAPVPAPAPAKHASILEARPSSSLSQAETAAPVIAPHPLGTKPASIPDFAPVVSEGGAINVAPVNAVPPVSPETAAPVSAPAAEQSWHAEKGQTLKTVLQDWAKAAHIQLYWATDYDYKLTTTMAYTGTFEDAVNKLFSQFSSAKPQPYGELHKKDKSDSVLIVNTYGTFN